MQCCGYTTGSTIACDHSGDVAVVPLPIKERFNGTNASTSEFSSPRKFPFMQCLTMTCTVFVLLSLLLAATAAFQYADEWNQWKAKYGKAYHDKRVEHRRQMIFESNMDFIEQHNARADQHGFKLAMNEFGDLVSYIHNHLYTVPINVYDCPCTHIRGETDSEYVYNSFS